MKYKLPKGTKIVRWAVEKTPNNFAGFARARWFVCVTTKDAYYTINELRQSGEHTINGIITDVEITLPSNSISKYIRLDSAYLIELQ